MGEAAGIAAVFSISILLLVVLAWYSVSRTNRNGGKTWIEIRAAGMFHFKFGTEINGESVTLSQGDRSATIEFPDRPNTVEKVRELGGQAQRGQLKIETKPPPVELPPGRRWRWPRKRAPSGGDG